VRVRFELARGLRWGVDLPDASDNCTSTPSAAICTAPESISPGNQPVGWIWDVVADSPGTYVLKADGESSVSDPDVSDNSSSVTVIVEATIAASAAKVTPSKPKAGSVISVRVDVTAAGNAVDPAGVSCAGTITGSKVRGTPRHGLGRATCVYRTPKSAKGKVLRGVIAFTANGTKVSRRFAVKLR
jgi:hypothetical protein